MWLFFPFLSLVALAFLWVPLSASTSNIIVFLSFVPGTPISEFFYIPPWEYVIFPVALISYVLRIHSSISLVQFLLKSKSPIAKNLRLELHMNYYCCLILFKSQTEFILFTCTKPAPLPVCLRWWMIPQWMQLFHLKFNESSCVSLSIFIHFLINFVFSFSPNGFLNSSIISIVNCIFSCLDHYSTWQLVFLNWFVPPFPFPNTYFKHNDLKVFIPLLILIQ